MNGLSSTIKINSVSCSKDKTSKFFADLCKEIPWITLAMNCCADAYRNLGHDLLEVDYQTCVSIGLTEQKLENRMEQTLSKFYLGKKYGNDRMDIVVKDKLVIELKVIAGNIDQHHLRQLHRYLIHGNYNIGFCLAYPKTYRCGLDFEFVFYYFPLLQANKRKFSAEESNIIPTNSTSTSTETGTNADENDNGSRKDDGGEFIHFVVRKRDVVPAKCHSLKTISGALFL